MKRIFVVFMLICFALVPGGCKSSQENDEQKTVISVGGYFADKNVNPENYYSQMEIVREFEKAHPWIKVEDAEWTFDPGSYLAMAEGNTLPTVYYVPFTEARNIMKQGYAADITEEFKKRGYYDCVQDYILENISKNGKIYLMPSSSYDQGLLINMELYKKAGYVDEDGTPYQPKTWEEVAVISANIKRITGTDGFVFPTLDEVAGWRFMPIAWSYGAEFEKIVDGRYIASFNSPECAEALQYLKDLKWKYKAVPEKADISWDESMRRIAENKAAMSIAEPAMVQRCIWLYGMDIDNVGFVSMPSGPKDRATLVGGGFQVVNKNATKKEIEAVMEWLDFIGVAANATEEAKNGIKSGIMSQKERGYLIGMETVEPWKSSTETVIYKHKLFKENINVSNNHIKRYNDKTGISFKLEEPVDAQALYLLLSSVIKEVFSDENADPSALLAEAAEKFQKNNLNYIQ